MEINETVTSLYQDIHDMKQIYIDLQFAGFTRKDQCKRFKVSIQNPFDHILSKSFRDFKKLLRE